ncbi:MAG: HlyD family secretion protein [Proteobacteria bacterium]|nr:HlyD family secretion protein [Pseudomonadota bacterium]
MRSADGGRAEALEPITAKTEETRVQSEEQKVASAPPTKSRRRQLIISVVAIAAAVAVIGYGSYYWTTGRFLVSTDDAYVGASIAQVSARVPARVAEVRFEDNQRVKEGQPLVILDDADYKLAVDQAKAKYATQQATVERIGRQIEAGRAAVTQAVASQDSAQAELVRAEADFERTNTLATNQFSSRATLDTSRATRDKARAALASAKAGVSSAETNVAVLQASKTEAERTASELKVAVDKAERDLDGTVIRAPVDGVMGNRSVQVGDYVTAGKRLAALIPVDQVYVDANFKETQLARIKPGQIAHVSVDAAGGASFDGVVTGIAPASGSQYSLLPPENATGNFTKIVQRAPVRIRMPRAAIEQGVLRPGFSVVATVDTRGKGETEKTMPSPAVSSPATAQPSAAQASK